MGKGKKRQKKKQSQQQSQLPKNEVQEERTAEIEEPVDNSDDVVAPKEDHDQATLESSKNSKDGHHSNEQKNQGHIIGKTDSKELTTDKEGSQPLKLKSDNVETNSSADEFKQEAGLNQHEQSNIKENEKQIGIRQLRSSDSIIENRLMSTGESPEADKSSAAKKKRPDQALAESHNNQTADNKKNDNECYSNLELNEGRKSQQDELKDDKLQKFPETPTQEESMHRLATGKELTPDSIKQGKLTNSKQLGELTTSKSDQKEPSDKNKEDTSVEEKDNKGEAENNEKKIDKQKQHNNELLKEELDIVYDKEQDKEQKGSESQGNEVKKEIVLQKNFNTEEKDVAQTKESETDLAVHPGPFSIETLIGEIQLSSLEISESQNTQITCVSAYENNVYLGTQHGEILHFYKLDAQSGYILISRQRVHHNKTRAISKILLLPQVSKALILNGSMVNVFLLPEMSPANMGKIKDVNDLTIDVDEFAKLLEGENFVENDQNAEVPVVLFTKKMIRVIRVSNDSLKLVKDITYANTIRGLRRSKFSLVATKTTYDLIDIDSFQKIPLLPFSSLPENEVKISPYILPILKGEFLITCGTTPEGPAMGMVVNKNGDVSRGTIAWDTYPTSVTVSYPYVLAVTSNSPNNDSKDGGYQLLVHSINEQREVQKIEFPHKITLVSVMKVFEESYEPLADVVKNVYLNFAGDYCDQNDYQDDDFVKLKNLWKVKSSTLLYDSISRKIEILKALPTLSRINNMIVSHKLDELQKEYDDFLVDQNINEELNMEEKTIFSFMRYAIGFIFIIDKNYNDAFRLWTNQYDTFNLNILANILPQNIPYDAHETTADTKSKIILDLLLRLNVKIIISVFNLLIAKRLPSQHIDESLTDNKQVVLYKGLKGLAREVVSDTENPNGLISFLLKLLLNWLGKFQELLAFNSSTQDKMLIASENWPLKENRESDVLQTSTSHLSPSAVLPQKKQTRRSFNAGTLENSENSNKKPQTRNKRANTETISSNVYQNSKAVASDTNLESHQSFSETTKVRASLSRNNVPIIISKLNDGDIKGIPDDLLEVFKTIEISLLNYFIIDSVERKTDKSLLLYLNNHAKLSIDEDIAALIRWKKYAVILQVYESLNKNREYFTLWMELLEGVKVDESFPVNKNDKFKKEELNRMKEKILTGGYSDNYITEYLMFLLKINQKTLILDMIFDERLFEKPSSDELEIKILKILSVISEGDKNYTTNDMIKLKDGIDRFENLKIGYLEQVLSSGKKLKYAGLLVSEYVKFLFELISISDKTGKKSLIETFIQKVFNDYQNISDYPKTSILNYLKIQTKLLSSNDRKLRSLMVKFLDVQNKLINSVYSLSQQNFIDQDIFYEDFEQVKGTKYQQQELTPKKEKDFEPYRIMSPKTYFETLKNAALAHQVALLIALVFIESSLGLTEKVIDRLTAVTDFDTVEIYITTKGAVLFGKHLKQGQGSKSVEQSQSLDDAETRDLVLKLYRSYLANHSKNQKLIESFLVRYSRYLDLHLLLNTMPDNSSLRVVSKTVLMGNLVFLNDEYANALMKKNLARSELSFYNKLLRQLRDK